ncbi:MAG TPA: thymidine kinase [Elusimicrobiales bacterium]|nr:thymidine kinase [Elusimicrobiales bacterium]HPO94700.1 thymidine kinase [Elusimicrobiales bacterium]
MIHISNTNNRGSIEVICGSMFSGKTQELIRRLRLATIAKQKVQIFNSYLDTRYAKEHIVSHDKSMLKAQPVKSAKEIIKKVEKDTQVVGIDEAHFFDDDILDVANKLANEGKRVIIAGLDMDWRGKPFNNMAKLMAVAEYVTKNLAICMVCGNPAHYSQKLVESESRIEVGASDKYEARCRKCFNPDLAASKK